MERRENTQVVTEDGPIRSGTVVLAGACYISIPSYHEQAFFE